MRPALFLLLLSAAACSGGGDDDDGLPGEWTAAQALPGGDRQETAVVALDGKVFVLGGFTGTGAIVADVEVFDPANGTWDTAAALPVAMHHANAAVADGKIWVLGFLTEFSFTADGRVFQYDAVADAWTEGVAMPLGTERGASGVAVIGNDVYVAGGLRDGAAVADFSVFSATTGTAGGWTGLVDLPAARDHLGAGAIGGIVHAVGGRNGSITGHVAELLTWDPASPGAWTPKASMPTSRGGLAASVMNDKLYVFGGEGNTALPSGVFSETERYDPATDTWTVMEPMLTPRHGTGAATVGDAIWVPAGADEEAFAAIDSNESFADPPIPEE